MIYNIIDFINNIIINKFNKPYFITLKHGILKIHHQSINFIDTVFEDEVQTCKIRQQTYVTNIITKKDYIINTGLLTEEECNKCNILYNVNTISIPVTFKIK